MSIVMLDGNSLDLENFIKIVRNNEKVDLSQEVKAKMQKSRRFSR